MESKWLWMVLVALLLGGCDGCWEQEKTALLQLKPFFSHIWEEGKQTLDCCEWKWVKCNKSTGRVMQLFLNLTTTEASYDLVYYENSLMDDSYDYISGRDDWYLNATLFLPFEELKSLHLSENSIAGCIYNEGIKRLSKLSNLEILDLQGNMLGNNILSHLNGFTSLKSLRLQNCGLKGSIDILDFCELTNLQELDISRNNLKDKLPECFSNLTSLESLSLSSNQFSGNISALESLTSLESLDLSSNQFSGNISALKSLTSLQVLSVANNYIQIPSSLGPLFNLSKLKYISADIYAETEMHSSAPPF
ncbi:hypothetical protein CRYUN_Cryun33cG0036300 [Craigia yunnanensis]